MRFLPLGSFARNRIDWQISDLNILSLTSSATYPQIPVVGMKNTDQNGYDLAILGIIAYQSARPKLCMGGALATFSQLSTVNPTPLRTGNRKLPCLGLQGQDTNETQNLGALQLVADGRLTEHQGGAPLAIVVAGASYFVYSWLNPANPTSTTLLNVVMLVARYG